MLKRIAVIFWVLVWASVAFAQDGTTLDLVNVRTQASREGALISQIAINTPLIIEARNSTGDWLLVHSSDNLVRGWVSARFIGLAQNVTLMQLPVSSEIIGATAQTQPSDVTPQDLVNAPPTVAPPLAPVVGGSTYNQLMKTPIFPTIGVTARQIIANGRSRGNDPHFFVKAGDNNIGSSAMLGLIGMGLYDLGSYGTLQNTINYFSASQNSFTHNSLIAGVSYNTSTIFGTADEHLDVCPVSTTLIECEYTVYRPSVVLMQFLIADIHALTIADFDAGLRKTVQTSIDMGVLPVLFTFPYHPDMPDDVKANVLAGNQIILDVAKAYNIPLVNLFRSLQALPMNGLQQDHIHMQYAGEFTGEDMVRFTGEENRYGYTHWNLLALQMLEKLVPYLG